MNVLNQIIKVVSGNFVTTLFGIIAMPLISRIYLPSTFGIATYFTTIVSILLIASSLKYPKAIMLPTKENKRHNLAVGSFYLSVANICIISIGIYFLGDLLFVKISMPEIIPYLWIIPFALLINSGNTILGFYLKRHNYFGYISLGLIVASIISVCLKVIVGFKFDGNVLGLIFGNQIAILVTLIISIIVYVKKIMPGTRQVEVSFNHIKEVFREYLKFPTYEVGISLLNLVSKNGVVLYLGYFFDNSVIGYYGMAFLLIRLPISVFVTALSDVFYRFFSMTDKINDVIPKLLEFLLKIALIPTIILASLGKEIFIFALGKHWEEAGVYSQFMAIIFIFNFIIAPLNSVFLVKAKNNIFLINNLILFLLTFLSVFVGGYFSSSVLAVFLISLSFGISYILIGRNIFKIAGINISQYFLLIMKYFLIIIPMVIAIIFVKYISIYYTIIILLSFSLFFIYYAMYKSEKFSEFILFLKNT